ncbi:JmjC domain-containing protein [Stella sp.]|uniref:JmjC domain-containing protein n=1 Tax=Stella sp. TaxID=2912054 RepID=UPI0035AE4156
MTDADPRLARRLEALLAPIGPARFFGECFGRAAALLPGAPERAAGVMDLAELDRLLNQTSIWTARTLQLVIDGRAVVTEEYCRPAVDSEVRDLMRPVPRLVTAWIRRGATLVLNNIGELNDGLAETAAALRAATGAPVQANLYFSRQGRQAFNPHFDTHEVFALHCHGEKRWRIFENRAEAPTPRSIQAAAAMGRKDEPGAVRQELTLRPGDLLYLPRGQFHDALASTQATIHVTFAVSMPSGVDLLRFLAEEGVLDPALRRDLPLRPNRKRLEAASGPVAERLAAMARDPAFLAALAQHLQAQAPAFDRYDLAAALAAPLRYRPRRDAGTRLVEEGGRIAAEGRFGRVPLPPALAPVARWALTATEEFDHAALAALFPALSPDQVGQAAESLVNLRLAELV